MGKLRRIDVGGYAYHGLNRSAGRRRIFRSDRDFAAFERVLSEALQRSAGRRRPYGGQAWVSKCAAAFGLEACAHRPGRPRNPQ